MTDIVLVDSTVKSFGRGLNLMGIDLVLYDLRHISWMSVLLPCTWQLMRNGLGDIN